jgi:hydroxyacylglutathione hydrolase
MDPKSMNFLPPRPKVFVLRMQWNAMVNYNYLIVDSYTRESVIVDPAWEMSKIDDTLSAENVKLSGILITHAHMDHINLAVPLANARDCPIWMSKREIELSGFRHRNLVGIDAVPMKIGGMLIEPQFTPGHTPGCFCYLIGQNLFTGDVLFAEGCGMCPDREAAYLMYSSLEYLKAVIPPQTQIYPGHSYGRVPGQLFSDILRSNIYLQFQTRESFAEFRMRKHYSKVNIFGN